MSQEPLAATVRHASSGRRSVEAASPPRVTMIPDNQLAHDLKGTGPLLVAVHGITENRSFWDPVCLQQHFRVLRVDLRGHGDSPRTSPFGIDESVEDIHHLIESLGEDLTGDQPPFVVGHSLGGVIATAYAARYPTRGVVNVDQSLRVGPLPAEIAIAVQGEGFADFVRTVFASLYGELDPVLVADIERRRTLDQDVFSGFGPRCLMGTLTAWQRGLDGPRVSRLVSRTCLCMERTPVVTTPTGSPTASPPPWPSRHRSARTIRTWHNPSGSSPASMSSSASMVHESSAVC